VGEGVLGGLGHVEVLEGVELPHARSRRLLACGRDVIALLDFLGVFPCICIAPGAIFVNK